MAPLRIAVTVIATMAWSAAAGRSPTGPLFSYCAQAITSPCIPYSKQEIVSGVFMTNSDANESEVIVENGEVRLLIRGGAVGLFVDPSRPEKKPVTVVTPLGELRVTGAVFTTQVDVNEVRLEVFRGTVDVIPAGDKAPVFGVVEGYGAELKQRIIFKLPHPNNSPLLEMACINRPCDSGCEEGIFPDDGTRRDVSGMGPAAVAGTEPLEFSSMEALIDNAQSCLLERDWECAAMRYNTVLERYPRIPESRSVLISLAKIELRHLNLPRTALSHFNIYLQRTPEGPLAEEAYLGMADVYQHLGSREKEKVVLHQFAKKFPRSVIIEIVRARLRRLDDALSD